MLKNDKDGCLLAITQESKLQMYKIRRTLYNVIRNRKRGDEEMDLPDQENTSAIKINQNTSMERSPPFRKLTLKSDEESVKYQNTGFKSNSPINSPTKIFDEPDMNRDSAIFRFRDGMKPVIVSDGELAAALSRSANHKFWREIASVHTLVKSRVGLGKSK